MNKLHDLLRYRNDLLDQIKFLNAKLDISQPLMSLDYLNTHHINVSFSVDHISNFFVNLQDEIQEKNSSAVQELKKLIQTVEDQIDTVGQNLINGDDTDINGQDLTGSVYTRINISDLSPPEPIMVKIKSYCDWHYPGLLVSPMNKFWIDTMITCDPFYLLSFQYPSYYLEEITSDYPIEYQKRLRLYKNYHFQNFSQLPNNQFGFILAWNVLSNHSINAIEKYLILILSLLRPGGVFMFNYNNCDHPELADSIETTGIHYCNQRILKKLCEKNGYKIIQFGEHKLDNHNDWNPYLSWIEIQKPGELTTSKLSPALGAILSK
jgi:SAM-dependent methyltransferase